MGRLPVEIKSIEPATREDWMFFCNNCAEATFFHTPMWAGLFERTRPARFVSHARIVRFADGSSACLPMVAKRHLHGLVRIACSMPADTYGGWLSLKRLSSGNERALLKYLSNFPDLILRENPFMPVRELPGCMCVREDFTQCLDLSGGYDSAWERAQRPHRKAVRHARKCGVEVREACDGKDWEDYFAMYAASIARWRNRGLFTGVQYDEPFFNEIEQLDNTRRKLFVAILDNRIVSGIICFYWQHHAVAWHGAGFDEYFSSRPNNLLYDYAIQHAASADINGLTVIPAAVLAEWLISNGILAAKKWEAGVCEAFGASWIVGSGPWAQGKRSIMKKFIFPLLLGLASCCCINGPDDSRVELISVRLQIRGPGRISGYPDGFDTTLAKGKHITLLAVPDDGAIFTGWNAGDFTAANPLDIVVAGKVFITAFFAARPPDLVFIAARDSAFTMGSADGSAHALERPPHEVRFTHDFFLGSCEVTAGEYWMTLDGSLSGDASDSLPVTNVSWYDAALYCNARSRAEGYDTVYSYSARCEDAGACPYMLENLVIHYERFGYRLPTEAEWEYGCRAGSDGEYFWDETKDADKYGWYFTNSSNRLHAPGGKSPNGFGLFDMAGNAAEWVKRLAGFLCRFALC